MSNFLVLHLSNVLVFASVQMSLLHLSDVCYFLLFNLPLPFPLFPFVYPPFLPAWGDVDGSGLQPGGAALCMDASIFAFGGRQMERPPTCAESSSETYLREFDSSENRTEKLLVMTKQL